MIFDDNPLNDVLYHTTEAARIEEEKRQRRNHQYDNSFRSFRYQPPAEHNPIYGWIGWMLCLMAAGAFVLWICL